MMNNQELIQSLRRISYIALFFIGAIVVISAVEQKQVSDVKAVRIAIEPLADGYFLIDSADIHTTIERSFGFNLEGQQLAILDVERVERVLEADPFILDADVYVTAGNVIKIEVLQREPVLRIIDRNGLNYYLDEQGNRLPLSRHFSARVLVATGNIPPHVPDFLEREQYLLKDLLELARLVREDPLWKVMVEEIHLQNGSFVLIPKLGNQRIVFGPFKDVDDKFRRLRLFYEHAVPYAGWREYKTVNLSYRGQVVCEKW